MRHFQSDVILLLFASLILSCGSLLLPPLEVVSVSTGNDIRIVFSAPPSGISIIKAFSLTEDNIIVSGTFAFDDKTVIFSPVNGIRVNRGYKITISTIAEDREGNSLLREFQYQFFTKQDIEAPRVISIFPENEARLDTVLDKIDIVFSEPVNIVSFSDAFRISPSLDFLLEWDVNNSAVSIVPAKPLADGTRYTVTINTALADESNNRILENFLSTFLYGTDRVYPSFSIQWESQNGQTGTVMPESINEHIPSDSTFSIQFDEVIAVETISGFIELTPSADIAITPDLHTRDRAVINFSSRPEWNMPYTLKIKKGIADTSGNKTETDSSFSLIFNNEDYRPVVFEGGFFKNGLTYDNINEDTDFSFIELNAVDFPQGIIRSTDLYLVFRISASADSISLVSAMRSITVSATNSCVSISLRTMQILSDTEYQVSDIYGIIAEGIDNGKLSVVKLTLELNNTTENGFIVFSVDRNIIDNLDNNMKNPVELVYNKQ
jgi:hypothetical protein